VQTVRKIIVNVNLKKQKKIEHWCVVDIPHQKGNAHIKLMRYLILCPNNFRFNHR
jgi:phage pi2 protein 07